MTYPRNPPTPARRTNAWPADRSDHLIDCVNAVVDVPAELWTAAHELAERPVADDADLNKDGPTAGLDRHPGPLARTLAEPALEARRAMREMLDAYFDDEDGDDVHRIRCSTSRATTGRVTTGHS